MPKPAFSPETFLGPTQQRQLRHWLASGLVVGWEWRGIPERGINTGPFVKLLLHWLQVWQKEQVITPANTIVAAFTLDQLDANLKSLQQILAADPSAHLVLPEKYPAELDDNVRRSEPTSRLLHTILAADDYNPDHGSRLIIAQRPLLPHSTDMPRLAISTIR